MESNYSPMLKEAAEEIKAIIAKYDIGAMVLLHTPGHSEYINEISPSYSCMTKVPTKEGEVGYRIRAKLQEDFNGDKDAWTQKISDTVNMIDLFAVTAGNTSLGLMDILKQLEGYFEMETTPVTHIPHKEKKKNKNERQKE